MKHVPLNAHKIAKNSGNHKDQNRQETALKEKKRVETNCDAFEEVVDGVDEEVDKFAEVPEAPESHNPVERVLDPSTHAAHGVQHLEEDLRGVNGVENGLVANVLRDGWRRRGILNLLYSSHIFL